MRATQVHIGYDRMNAKYMIWMRLEMKEVTKILMGEKQVSRIFL
jgi:hypothetical protein